MNEAEEDVLRPDVRVVQQTRFFLRQYHHSPGSISESFEHKSECIGGVSRLLSGRNLRVFPEKREYSRNCSALAGDHAGIETREVQPAVEPGVLDLQAAVHHHVESGSE